MMGRHSFFHQVKALIVFLVFGFSLLPRQVVHDFVTSHQHIKYAASQGEHVLTPDTVNCNGVDLFLQQTYAQAGNLELSEPAALYASQEDFYRMILLPIDAHPAATRGPPVVS
jgi:hypothetical protein